METRNNGSSTPARSRKRGSTTNKACIPCGERKIKCDAATVGIPCNNCISRQCSRDCALPDRKRRTVKPRASSDHHELAVDSDTIENHDASDPGEHAGAVELKRLAAPVQSVNTRKTGSDLLYLNILHDAVDDNVGSGPSVGTGHTNVSDEDSLTPANCQDPRLPHLDAIDRDYLVSKGVFDLPPRQHLDVLIKTYFTHFHPFCPALDRKEFIHGYQVGDCSLYLLRAVLTASCLQAPLETLQACGYADRSAAQNDLFSKTRLLDDFLTESDVLLKLQASIIMSAVILDHPTDRDCGFYYFEAIRLADKLDLHEICLRGDRSRKAFRVYRNIWWALYTLDTFYVFVNPRRNRLFASRTTTQPESSEHEEGDIDLDVSHPLLPPFTVQQRNFIVVRGDLSRIFDRCLTNLKLKPQHDPQRLLDHADIWRRSLADKMQIVGNPEDDIYYLSLKAFSYRFECTLCRMLRRQMESSVHKDWREWPKQHLRSSVLELDTIAMRVLASGTFHLYPVAFVTTMTALLALHIETALDPEEKDLTKSMARISINQTMLLLEQGKDIPALKRAVPLFEDILEKKHLRLSPSGSVSRDGQQVSPRQAQVAAPEGDASSIIDQIGTDLSMYGDVLGLSFLDDWTMSNWPPISELDPGT